MSFVTYSSVWRYAVYRLRKHKTTEKCAAVICIAKNTKKQRQQKYAHMLSYKWSVTLLLASTYLKWEIREKRLEVWLFWYDLEHFYAKSWFLKP